MAFENKELAQMIELARSSNINVLIGALCVHSMGVTTDMMSDMLYDNAYIREEGMPNLARLTDMASDQVLVVFPDIAAENGELDDEPKKGDNESSFEMIVRAFMKQILKQRPDLAKLEFQPR